MLRSIQNIFHVVVNSAAKCRHRTPLAYRWNCKHCFKNTADVLVLTSNTRSLFCKQVVWLLLCRLDCYSSIQNEVLFCTHSEKESKSPYQQNSPFLHLNVTENFYNPPSPTSPQKSWKWKPQTLDPPSPPKPQKSWTLEQVFSALVHHASKYSCNEVKVHYRLEWTHRLIAHYLMHFTFLNSSQGCNLHCQWHQSATTWSLASISCKIWLIPCMSKLLPLPGFSFGT